MPTHAQPDVENRSSPPARAVLDGRTVLTGFTVTNPLHDIAVEQVRPPDRIGVPNIRGMSTVVVRWIVQGGGVLTVTADSPKGGVHVRRSH